MENSELPRGPGDEFSQITGANQLINELRPYEQQFEQLKRFNSIVQPFRAVWESQGITEVIRDMAEEDSLELVEDSVYLKLEPGFGPLSEAYEMICLSGLVKDLEMGTTIRESIAVTPVMPSLVGRMHDLEPDNYPLPYDGFEVDHALIVIEHAERLMTMKMFGELPDLNDSLMGFDTDIKANH